MPIEKARIQDVAGDNQPPEKMRYGDWAPLGFCGGFVQVRRGAFNVPHAARHRQLMRAASYLTAPYAAFSPTKDVVETMKALIGGRLPEDELPDMADFEVRGLTESQIRRSVEYHKLNSTAELIMYTGYPFWMAAVPDVARGYYAPLDLLIAAYPFDAPPDPITGKDAQPMDPASVDRRSKPPAFRTPLIPVPWTDYWAWQHTGHGTLPGYDGFLDMSVSRFTEQELRTRYKPGTVPAPAEDSVLAARILGHVAAMRALLEG